MDAGQRKKGIMGGEDLVITVICNNNLRLSRISIPAAFVISLALCMIESFNGGYLTRYYLYFTFLSPSLWDKLRVSRSQ